MNISDISPSPNVFALADAELSAPALALGPVHAVLRRYAELSLDDFARWAELTRLAGTANVFANDWFMAAALEFCDQDQDVRLLIVTAQDGRWIGLLPFVTSASFGQLPIKTAQVWAATNQFLRNPLVLPQAESAFWTAALNLLDAEPGGIWALHCPQFARNEAICEALAALCAAEGRSLFRLKEFSRSARTRKSAANADPAPLDKSQRKLASRLRSQSARLTRDHGATSIVLHPAGQSPDGWINDFLTLERSGWKGQAGSALACFAATENLFRTVVQRGTANGTVRLATLRIGDRPIAMANWFITGQQGFGFKMAYDEAFSAYAPGLLLMQHVAELVDQHPVLEFDTCGAADSQHYKHIWPDRREMLDFAVAIGPRWRRMAFGVLMTARRAWRRIKA